MEEVCDSIKKMCDFSNPDYIDSCIAYVKFNADEMNLKNEELANYIFIELEKNIGYDVSCIHDEIINDKIIVSFVYKESWCEISTSTDYSGCHLWVLST